MKKKIAIIKDEKFLRFRLLVKLIELAGGEAILINQEFSKNALEKDNPLTYHLAEIKELIQDCNGVIFPGNTYDVNPKLYNENYIHPFTKIDNRKNFARYKTETLLLEHALSNNWPIIAICGGMQMLNSFLGGSLIQHLPEEPNIKKHGINHRDPSLKNISKKSQYLFERNFEKYLFDKERNIFPQSHAQEFEKNSILGKIYQQNFPNINLNEIYELSIHHQGCFEKNLSSLLKPIALAKDGIVEAAEIKNYKNISILTQFHFECNVSKIAYEAVKLLVDNA